MEKLPGMEIPREFWPGPENSGGSLPGFLSENPCRLWRLSSDPKWLFFVVIMPGPVGWACLIGPLPDQISLSFGPTCNDIWTEALLWLGERGCPVVQFLGDIPGTPQTVSIHPPIAVNPAFRPVTDFYDLFFIKNTGRETLPPIAGFTWQPSVAGDCREIALKTMVGSLDCPELAHYRSDNCAWDSLIQIHGPQKTCWILHGGKTPAGILLGHIPEQEFATSQRSGEISYFGLAPEFRGKHLGSGMLSHFLSKWVPEGASMVTMVDSMNVPAFKTYQRVGFEKSRTSRLFLAKT